MNHASRAQLAVLACLAGLAAGASRAGELDIYEASVGPGGVRALAGPVTNALIDLDYAPATAEGGKLYGMSEIEIEATGNLMITPTGFACQAASCLYAPLPFAAGKRILVTAGNDLTGETAAAANLLTIGLTGSTGHLVLVRGEYLDGTGAAGKVGVVRTVDPTPLVTVPEPGFAAAVAAGSGLLARLRRRGRR